MVRVTVLVDNRAEGGLGSEHGLSMWIEAGGCRVLFDTGQGGLFAENARALGVAVEEADAIVLSHGHYDHTGGLAEALARAPRARLYAHPGVTQERFSLHPGRPARSIGMPGGARTALKQLDEDRIVWVEGPVDIAPGVHLTGIIPRYYDFEDTGGPFFLDGAGHRPDPIADDMALWLDTPGGIVLCAGCCHAGIANTVRRVGILDDAERPFRAILGGLHLLHADDRRMSETMAMLEDLGPALLSPGHCTGDAVIPQLAERFAPVYTPFAAGRVFGF